jgi:hypothetical protein
MTQIDHPSMQVYIHGLNVARLTWASTSPICLLSDVATVSSARSRDRRLGESAQEVAAVGGPDEALGHDRIALVVDPEAPAVMSHDQVRSTIQCLGGNSKRPGWMRLTTSTPT